MTKKRPVHVVLSVIGYILCALFGFMLLCNLTIIIKGVVSPDIPPSVFGITPMVVQSGSMSGSAADHIEVGDLILIGSADPETLQIGDIITFKEDAAFVTHRIVDIQTDADGKRSFITKGDANNIEDPAVREDAVFGLYIGRVAKLGDFAMFLQKPIGMAVFIGIPVCAFIVYDILRRQKATGKADKENEALRAELEKLRAEAGQKPADES